MLHCTAQELEVVVVFDDEFVVDVLVVLEVLPFSVELVVVAALASLLPLSGKEMAMTEATPTVAISRRKSRRVIEAGADACLIAGTDLKSGAGWGAGLKIDCATRTIQRQCRPIFNTTSIKVTIEAVTCISDQAA